MREYQAIVRVRHQGVTLAETGDQLDTITGALLGYGATAQLWPDVSEWTLTVRVPTIYDVAHFAGRAVQDAYASAGIPVILVRADAWNVTEWESAKGLSD